MYTRTHLCTSVLDDAPKPKLYTYDDQSPIAVVSLDGGSLEISGTEPARLLLIAEAFTDAARQLSDQLDREAAAALNAERVPA